MDLFLLNKIFWCTLKNLMKKKKKKEKKKRRKKNGGGGEGERERAKLREGERR